MTAHLLDTFDELDGAGLDSLAGALETAPAIVPKAAAVTPAAPPPQDDGIPDKYRGKEAKDLIEIIRSQETMIGRQSQEVGAARQAAEQARSLVDKALKFQVGTGRADPNLEDRALTSDSLLARPQESVAQVARQVTQPLESRLDKLDSDMAAGQFASAHPTAMTDINDPNFVAWVQQSKIRTKLAQLVFADPDKTNWVAAEDLWSDYEPLRKGVTTVPNTQLPQNPQTPTQVPDVALVRGGGGGGGTQDTSGKERFKASKLIQLQDTKPDEYWSPAVQKRINAGIVIDDL